MQGVCKQLPVACGDPDKQVVRATRNAPKLAPGFFTQGMFRNAAASPSPSWIVTSAKSLSHKASVISPLRNRRRIKTPSAGSAKVA